MSAADGEAPVSAAEAEALFADLPQFPAIVVAVSGGPDSTALLALLARWLKSKRQAPKLIAVTVDHGLRPQSAGEARAVRRLAGSLGVMHRTLRWTGPKPAAGLQDAARRARYRLLAKAARQAGAPCVLTAHTRDDQAETVLFRLARGSGLTGLGAMAPKSPLPVKQAGEIALLRPLLDVSKARLLATLRRLGLPYADDESNRDVRFARPRLRRAMPALAAEGLDAARLTLLARRVRRAEAAIEANVTEAAASLAPPPWPDCGPVSFSANPWCALPEEIGLRLLGRALAWAGDEGPVELAKLETLHAELMRAGRAGRLRRTLAGALVTLSRGSVSVERAPRRRAAPKPP